MAAEHEVITRLRKVVEALGEVVTYMASEFEVEEDGPYVVEFDCGAELHVLDTTKAGVQLSFTEDNAYSWWFDKASLEQLTVKLLEIHGDLEDDDDECDCDLSEYAAG